MRHGIRLGIDVGKARIGVARCDPSGMLATPVETVPRGDGDIARLVALGEEYEVIEYVVGLPLGMSGLPTPSTDDATGFADRLAAAVTVPIRLVDERLSTVSAQSALRASGRTTKGSRGVIDQAAAVVILQHALDAEQTRDTPPGSVVPRPPETWPGGSL